MALSQGLVIAVNGITHRIGGALQNGEGVGSVESGGGKCAIRSAMRGTTTIFLGKWGQMEEIACQMILFEEFTAVQAMAVVCHTQGHIRDIT
jgi:hypothetical protein